MLNPAGEYIFVPADVSLIRVVDQVCKKIGEKEKAINILLLSAGVADIHRTGVLVFHQHPPYYHSISPHHEMLY